MERIALMGEELLKARKEKVLHYLKGRPLVLIGIILALIEYISFYIRTKPLALLIDATTGDYIPSDPDAMGILRYVQYVVDHGQLMAVDMLRYFPKGYHSLEEFSVLSHLIAWFYQVYHFLSPTVTVAYADVLYPAVAFVVALVFFYLLVEKIFDWKTALLASAFLTVLPAYLYRTIAGVSDKEAMAMIFFYACLYFFLAFLLEKKNWKAIVYSVLSGLALGVLWSIWGAVVFITSTVGRFVFSSSTRVRTSISRPDSRYQDKRFF